MEDQNIIIYLDKIKKLLELGNVPKAITEIEVVITMLNKNISTKKGRIEPLLISETGGIDPYKFNMENRQKINELANFINQRFF